MEAILLVWGVGDDVLEKLPVDGYWLYGEYDFIAKLEFSNRAEMDGFEKTLRGLIRGGTFKLLPVKLSFAGVVENGEGAAVQEDVRASAP